MAQRGGAVPLWAWGFATSTPRSRAPPPQRTRAAWVMRLSQPSTCPLHATMPTVRRPCLHEPSITQCRVQRTRVHLALHPLQACVATQANFPDALLPFPIIISGSVVTSSCVGILAPPAARPPEAQGRAASCRFRLGSVSSSPQPAPTPQTPPPPAGPSRPSNALPQCIPPTTQLPPSFSVTGIRMRPGALGLTTTHTVPRSVCVSHPAHMQPRPIPLSPLPTR